VRGHVNQGRAPPARKLLLQGNHEALTGFTDDEVEQLVKLLTKLISNLHRMMNAKTA
jgi:MarR family transcriptional regulator, transcriptional regulator for hemolysin